MAVTDAIPAVAPAIVAAPTPEPELVSTPVPAPAPAPALPQTPEPEPVRVQPSAAAQAPRARAPAPANVEAQPRADTAPASTGVVQKTGWGAKKILVLLAIAAGAILFLKNGGNKESRDDAGCDQAFTAGISAIAAGDLVNARGQLTRATASCKGERLSRPTALQAALAKEETQHDDCDRRLGALGANLDEHNLVSVRDGLQNLSSACAADTRVAELRQRLSRQQAVAQEARGEARQRLDEHDQANAKLALDKFAAANGEAPELPAMNAELDKLALEAQAEPMPAPAPAAAPVPDKPIAPDLPAETPAMRDNALPSPRVLSPTPLPRRAEPAADTRMQNMQGDMAQGFLRDAERALAQRQFDAAKTYVESARRMDPNNPKLDSLTQRIHDRERQVLQQETSIK